MDWDPDFLARSPMFEPLRAHAPTFGAEWPDLVDLQRLLDRRVPPVRNAAGIPLRLAMQGRRTRTFEDRYEARLFLKGELQVRSRNWHDLFNVLVWLVFPRAKAALNARHFAELEKQRESAEVSKVKSATSPAGVPDRGPTQDALTLFDEGGVIVASDDDELVSMLETFRWKTLFWENRERVLAHMRFYVFGHALYEKALRPFIGVTGRGIPLRVEPGLLAMPLPEQIAAMDARVAAHMSDPASLAATRELAVVPILGVPGWCADNERESYYDNLVYFRPGRLRERRDK